MHKSLRCGGEGGGSCFVEFHFHSNKQPAVAWPTFLQRLWGEKDKDIVYGRWRKIPATHFSVLTICLFLHPGTDELSCFLCSCFEVNIFQLCFVIFLCTLYVFLWAEGLQLSDWWDLGITWICNTRLWSKAEWFKEQWMFTPGFEHVRHWTCQSYLSSCNWTLKLYKKHCFTCIGLALFDETGF